MGRTARLVLPGVPHHVVQRGNRRQTVFFTTSDRFRYLELLLESSIESGVDFVSYCLMDNHVHHIVVPEKEGSLAKCFGRAHMMYSREVNDRMGWRGHLWQDRFNSSPLDPLHLYNAVRYVEQNPVRAGLVSLPWRYRWSSAAFHAGEIPSDLLVRPSMRLNEIVGDWKPYLLEMLDQDETELFDSHAERNLPVGSPKFLGRIGALTELPTRERGKGRPEQKKPSL